MGERYQLVVHIASPLPVVEADQLEQQLVMAAAAELMAVRFVDVEFVKDGLPCVSEELPRCVVSLSIADG